MIVDFLYASAELLPETPVPKMPGSGNPSELNLHRTGFLKYSRFETI
jgi:hypothetical protein